MNRAFFVFLNANFSGSDVQHAWSNSSDVGSTKAKKKSKQDHGRILVVDSKFNESNRLSFF
jgi:hypothetical protein